MKMLIFTFCSDAASASFVYRMDMAFSWGRVEASEVLFPLTLLERYQRRDNDRVGAHMYSLW